jgi:SAM-dependent methyltransferase
MKELFRNIPVVGSFAKRLYWRIRSRRGAPALISDSRAYWERRYTNGGNSGAGSYGKFASFKAQVINGFISEHFVRSVIEFGSGDGNQLKLAEYPQYLGFDVSEAAVAACKDQFRDDQNKDFRLMQSYRGEKADLVLSLDVIYHLVEDHVYEDYMATLFKTSDRYVVIYSSDSDDNRVYLGPHIRHRKFTEWIRANVQGWKMIGHLPNKYPYHGVNREGSFADFYFYERAQ